VRVLLDENVPRRLRWYLPGHDVSTVIYLGWNTLKDGAVLDLAEQNGFQILITADRNLEYQQNIRSRQLAVLVLSANNWAPIQANLPKIRSSIEAILPSSLVNLQLTRR
jgi:predicted nuclease of predicted toxin-antitoxin system